MSESTDSQDQDSSFNSLGFVNKNARKNFVITVMVMLVGMIIYLQKENIDQAKQIAALNHEIISIKTAQADSSNAQYARLVARVQQQLVPVQQEARQIAQNVVKTDSLQREVTKKQ